MPAVQYGTYLNGGFYAHKIPHNGGTYSAYFGPGGVLLDAERTDPRGRAVTRAVSAREVNVRAALERIGRRFAATARRGAGV